MHTKKYSTKSGCAFAVYKKNLGVVLYMGESWASKHPWITGGIIVFAICCITGLIYALLSKPAVQTVTKIKPPPDETSDQIVNFMPSYNIAPGLYWVNQYSCDGANGNIPGYCAFTGAGAQANAEQTCEADPACVGYANMMRGGKQYYVLGSQAIADQTHAPNLYYSKPGAVMPALAHADSSSHTIAEVMPQEESGASSAEIAGAVWRASR